MISAPGRGGLQVSEGRVPEGLGVAAGSMWLQPKSRRQEVARAGVAESPGESSHRALTALLKSLNAALRIVGKQPWVLLVGMSLAS